MKTLSALLVVLAISCKDPKPGSSSDLAETGTGKIAFVTDRDGNPEVYIMDGDGANPENLTRHDSLDFSPSWSADGTSLSFYSKRDGNAEIYRMDLQTRRLTRLTNHPATDVLPVPSPDGSQILFMSDRDSLSRNVYVMDKDGSGIRQLTRNAVYEESPEWSPDGSQIAFTRQLRDSSDTSHAGNGEIFLMDAQGGGVKRLTDKEGYDSGAKFSPDGSKIAFYGAQGDQWDLYTIYADGTGLQNLTNDAIECYSPDWSPDGEWLVYTAGSKGNYNIWKINIHTKERVQLTRTDGRNEAPSWSR